MSQLFATASEIADEASGKVFGERGPNGKYHMPLLPGEQGPKAKGANWVSGGITSVTNLVGAFEETRALAIWEIAMTLCGLALDESLRQELRDAISEALLDGVKLENMREYPALRDALAGSHFDQEVTAKSIAGRARERAKAGVTAARGTAAHSAWEERGASGRLTGDAEQQMIVLRAERLLEEAGLERVPGLSERVVRNLEVNTTGRFDDILLERATGRLLMADLKTKPRPFFSYMTVDAQLACYAYSEWMLMQTPKFGVDEGGDPGYQAGPRHHVDLTEGVILHVPSDGAPPTLERADLLAGWETAKLARKITEHRSAGKSAERFRRSAWVPRK